MPPPASFARPLGGLPLRGNFPGRCLGTGHEAGYWFPTSFFALWARLTCVNTRTIENPVIKGFPGMSLRERIRKVFRHGDASVEEVLVAAGRLGCPVNLSYVDRESRFAQPELPCKLNPQKQGDAQAG